MYGSIIVEDENGDKVVWLYDYANEKPRLKEEMTPEEIAESERAKFDSIKKVKQ